MQDVPVEATGPAIRLAEATPFANRKCKTCFGTGWFFRVVGVGHEPQVCGCAMKRFMGRHSKQVVPVKGQLHWRASDAVAKPETGDCGDAMQGTADVVENDFIAVRRQIDAAMPKPPTELAP